MGALEHAKTMSREDVLKKIAALEIQESGIHAGPLTAHFDAALAENVEEGTDLAAVAALNNADTDQVLLEVLKNDPEKIFEGLAIAAYALGTEKMVLYVPEAETALAESLADTAAKYQTEVKAEFLNIRENKGNALIHIVTCADLADAFSDAYTPGVYVSVNGVEVKKVAADTKIADLADTEGAKALLLGYRLHQPEDAQLTVAEAGIANGVIRVLTEKDCIVAETEKKLTASRKQSCGKCVFCREGLIQLQYMQKETAEGRGKMEFLDLTKEIGEAMCCSTPCSMGQVSAEIALTATEIGRAHV